MNFKKEYLEFEEWKPELSIHHIIIEKTVKCEIKEEFDNNLKIKANENLEIDPLYIEEPKIKTESKHEIIENEDEFNQNETPKHNGNALSFTIFTKLVKFSQFKFLNC